jgi:hypothetical protein
MAAKRASVLFVYTSIPMSEEGLLILAVIEAARPVALGIGCRVLTGVGNYRALHGRLAEALLQRADADLLAAKRGGRF